MCKMYKIVVLLLTTFLSTAIMAQVTVKGKVTSSENPSGMMGVTVREKGSAKGTVSDKDGNYELQVKSANSTLEFVFVGYKTQTVALAGKTTASVVLREDNSALNEVVITASRAPVRKLETTTSVEIIGSKTLKLIRPEGIAEAVTSTPGLYVNTSQGRRGTITTRGFPDGGNPLGGLDYTSILIDGLPSFGSTGRLPEAGFGFDNNVEKVEVVRGGAATLFGRASAAGAINVISKTGGTQTAGSVRYSRYDNIHTDNSYANYRIDWNLNGSLTADKLVRFNIGGWFLDDRGFKKTGNNDNGYQLRGNFDFLTADNSMKNRISFLLADYVFQNLTDAPVNPATMGLAPGWNRTNTFQNFAPFKTINYDIWESGAGFTTRPVLENGKVITRSMADAHRTNNYGKTVNIGWNFEKDLGNGFSIDNKLRFQSIRSGTKYSFAIASFYAANANVFRTFLDGDAADQDLMNELRINKVIKGSKVKHHFTLGGYVSKTWLNPTTYAFSHGANISGGPDNITFGNVAALGNAPYSGFFAGQIRGSLSRRGNYTEKVTSVFFGDEMKVGEKLTINFGARYDWMNIGMKENKKPYDVLLTRDESFSDWSASLGVNYLITPNSAIYGSINRAFKAPDYTAFTSLEWTSATSGVLTRLPNGLDGNERVLTAEIGYRTSVGSDLSVDVAVYNTSIENRLSSFFEGGILVSRPFGNNRITGGELSLTWNPSSIKGLTVRTNVTFQKSIFTLFKVTYTDPAPLAPGVNPNFYGLTANFEGTTGLRRIYSINLNDKNLPGVPSLIWNSSVVYTHKYFGIDFNSNLNSNRYVDPTNLLKYNDLLILNAGAYVRLPIKSKREIRIGAQVKNFNNGQAIQNIAGLGASAGVLEQLNLTPTFANTYAQGYLQLPRRWTAYISFDF